MWTEGVTPWQIWGKVCFTVFTSLLVGRSYHTHFTDTQLEHETHPVWRSPPAFWWPTVSPWQRSWSQSCGQTETVLLPFKRVKIHFMFSFYVDQRLLLFLKLVLSHLFHNIYIYILMLYTFICIAYIDTLHHQLIIRLSYETRFKPRQEIIIIIILNMYLLKLLVVPCLKPFCLYPIVCKTHKPVSSWGSSKFCLIRF